MHFNRDSHLRSGVRKLNWLRLEHYKRVCFVLNQWRYLILRSITRDSGLTLSARSVARQHLAKLPASTRSTKHTTRCWVSGRARQTTRRFLLARMHYRAALSEAHLPHVTLRRS